MAYLVKHGGGTLELDISTNENGYFIGHHCLYYKARGLVFPPPNVSIQRAITVVKKHSIFTKLDIKDEKAFDKGLELALQLGPENCLLHGFAEEFVFLGKEDKQEPYWQFEHLPLNKLLIVKQKAGNPFLQVSCRGFRLEGIISPKGNQVKDLDFVRRKAKAVGIETVSLNLPDCIVPPNWVLKKFFDDGILMEVYTHKIKGRKLPCPVFTSTDDISEVVFRKEK